MDSDDSRPDQQHDRSRDSDEALVSRLRLIEAQPLDKRADAYLHLHAELQEQLERGDQAPIND